MRLSREIEKYLKDLKNKGFSDHELKLVEVGMLKTANLLNLSIAIEIDEQIIKK